ncbi:hypothetical protein [Aneurinibacillus sp. REN35]|uniref:hypothetical protein n=1 Tax=Aneurinibacillus sp. REN35 TaxID=3237286 RepID=UPI0035290B37
MTGHYYHGSSSRRIYTGTGMPKMPSASNPIKSYHSSDPTIKNLYNGKMGGGCACGKGRPKK